MSQARRAKIGFALAALVAVFADRSARGEPTPPEKAAATALFREARGLLERGDTAAACRRFEESQRLDPQPGTLLNLAVCHEKEGRTATAWAELHDAAALARRDARDDRLALATEHERTLGPRLVQLRIVVPQDADAPGLTVALDGVELPRAVWGAPFPVDPGDHVVAIAAEHKVARTQHVLAAREGETTTVAIEPLDDVARPAPPAPAAEPAVPPIAAPLPEGPPAVVTAPTALTRTPGGLGVRREVAIALAGAALAGVATGTYFGLDAFAKHAESRDECPAPDRCTPRGIADNDASKTSADRSTVAFGVSIALAGAAVYLWLSERPRAASTGLHVAPVLERGGWGALVVGAF